MTRTMRLAAPIVLSALLLVGCLTQEDFDAVTAESQAAVVTMREEAERNQQEAALAREEAESSEGEAREAAQARLEAHQRLAGVLTERADELEAANAAGAALWEKYQTKGGEGLLEEVGKVVLPMLPPGAQGPGVLVIGVGGLLLRLANRSKVIKGIVRSLDAAKEADPDFAAGFKRNAKVIEKAQPVAAAKAVEAVQNKSLLPV